MKLKSVVASLSVMFFSYFAYSQDLQLVAQILDTPEPISYTGKASDLLFLCYNSIDKEVSGDIYLSDFWQDGVLLDKEKNTYSVVARYRVFDDEIQIQVNNKVKGLHKQAILGIRIGSQIFMGKEFLDDGVVNFANFEVLSEGNVTLLKQYEMKIRQRGEKKEALPLQSSLYFLKEGEPAQLLSKKHASILALFEDHQQEVKSFLSKKKLNLNSEKDLIEIFEYYNSL